MVKITWFSASVLYYAFSKLDILTELRAYDVKFISVDRQKLDLSKYITYGTVNSIFVEIQFDSKNMKNDHRTVDKSELIAVMIKPCMRGSKRGR